MYTGDYMENILQKKMAEAVSLRGCLSAFLIFGMFVAADYTGEKIWKYTPSQIVSQIEYQPDIMTGNW